jgi:hypothetical protein
LRPEAVGRDRARRRGVRDQRARGRAHLREALAAHLEARGERVVAAGVEDDEVELGARAVHAVEDLADLHREERDVLLAAHGRVDGDEVVAVLELHRVAGIEEERGVRALDRLAELADPSIMSLRVAFSRTITWKPSSFSASPRSFASLVALRSGVEP